MIKDSQEKQDISDNGVSIQNAPMCLSARLTLVMEGTFGFFCLYLLRVHFSVAMVCMTGSPVSHVYQNFSFVNSSYNETQEYTTDARIATRIDDTLEKCPGETSFTGAAVDTPGEFDWPKSLRGIMLSAFFWGYIITQIPSGWLTSIFGSKLVIAVGMLLANVANILIPAAARLHPYLVVVLRFIVGFGHGVMFPAMHSLWGKWAPPLERSRLIASTYAGTIIGTVVALSFAGFICTIDFDNGWPLIFYIYGCVAFVWWFLWLILVYNTPSEHPRISYRERVYIEQSIGPSAFTKKFPIPWRSIAASKAVWAIIVAHTANNWGSYTVLTCVPAYMKEVLNFDIKANGVLVSVPYVVMYILALFAGQLGDILRKKKICTTTQVRKIYQTIAFGVPAVFITAVGFVDCSRRYMAVAFLTVVLGATAFGRSAYSINHVDIAPRFAGVLFGITNTVATIPGMISPYIAAAITPNGTASEWRVVFFICGVIYAFGLLVYLLWGSGEEQAWAKINTTDCRDERVIELSTYEEKVQLKHDKN